MVLGWKVKGQGLGWGLTAIGREYELYECLLVCWCLGAFTAISWRWIDYLITRKQKQKLMDSYPSCYRNVPYTYDVLTTCLDCCHGCSYLTLLAVVIEYFRLCSVWDADGIANDADDDNDAALLMCCRSSRSSAWRSGRSTLVILTTQHTAAHGSRSVSILSI